MCVRADWKDLLIYGVGMESSEGANNNNNSDNNNNNNARVR